MKTLLVIAVAALGFAAPAFAECDPNAVQIAASTHLAAQAPTANLITLGAKMDNLAKDCPKNPYVMKVAAMLHGAMTPRVNDPGRAWTEAAAAWGYYNLMRDTRKAADAPIDVLVGDDVSKVDVNAADTLGPSLLRNLFIAEIKVDSYVPDHQPLKSGEKLSCRTYDADDAEAAAKIVRDNLKNNVAPALNLLDRISAGCAAKLKTGMNRRIPAARAGAYLQLVQANPARTDADALLAKASADSKAFLALNPDGDTTWSLADSDALNALVASRKKP